MLIISILILLNIKAHFHKHKTINNNLKILYPNFVYKLMNVEYKSQSSLMLERCRRAFYIGRSTLAETRHIITRVSSQLVASSQVPVTA